MSSLYLPVGHSSLVLFLAYRYHQTSDEVWHNIIWEKSLHAIFSHVLWSAFIFSKTTLESRRFMNVPITSVLLWILQVFQYHEFWRAFSLVLNFPWLLHWRSDICVCEYCKAFWSLETEEWHLFLPVLQSLLVSGDLTLNTVFFWSPIHFTHCKKRTHIWKTDYGWKLVKFEERCEGFYGGLWYVVFLVPCCVLGFSMASGMDWNLGC
jgi:hypothetical protein